MSQHYVQQITQELLGANFCKNHSFFCIDNWFKIKKPFPFEINIGRSLRHYVLDKISGNDVKHL